MPGGLGGASAIRFDPAGNITSAYRILGGTSTNCAGGPTPWGTWLSCEETSTGRVWECDVTTNAPTPRPALGVFQHEAACVDPVHQRLYLSEDVDGGGLYRFTPAVYPDLSAGVLEIACTGVGNGVIWKAVPDPTFSLGTPTRQQLPDSIKFRRGEGIWFDTGRVYLATTTDETIHVYDTNAGTVEVLYRAGDLPGTPLKGIDNDQATVYRPPPAPEPPAPPAPGVPIGLDLAKRISIAAFIRKGLAVGLTLDRPATVRVKVTAKLGRKTVTLASVTKTAKRGSTTVRIKPTKARAKTLRARRTNLKANVEIRVTTTGTPTRTFKRTVTLRH